MTRFNGGNGRTGIVLTVVVMMVLSPMVGVVAFTDTASAAPGDVLYRVNAGGDVVSDSSGADWAADDSSLYDGGTPYTAGSLSAGDIENPTSAPSDVYLTERSAETFSYEFSNNIESGTSYEVRLYLAEIYFGVGGPAGEENRVFDVSAEGQEVLTDYDVFAETGGSAVATVETFEVTPTDGTIDLSFAASTNQAKVSAIEIVEAGPEPGVIDGPSNLQFDTTVVGESATQTVTLTNEGESGDTDITVDGVSVTGANAGDFSTDFSGSTTLAPGESLNVPVTFTPSQANARSATLEVSHDAPNTASPLTVDLSGTGSSSVPVDFGHGELQGFSTGSPTSLDWGPDGRLYVSDRFGDVYALEIERTGEDSYQVTDEEQITAIKDIPNHNDDGSFDTSESDRQVTGLRVGGTADQPVVYVTSSHPEVQVGNAQPPEDSLDTNSGTLSRLTLSYSDGDISNVDHDVLVRGLPRSEENHAVNGIAIADGGDTLYVAVGGHTNQGAPGDKLSYLPEYALSASILEVDVAQIENNYNAKDALDANGDAYADYYYDLPTLSPSESNAPNGGPFGGLDGVNMAKLVQGGPVQVYSPGYRNPYDVVIRPNGDLYTIDNGHNGGWGDQPVGEGTEQCTNEINDGGGGGANPLHHIDEEGYYGGHANPTRGNPDGANVYAGGFQDNAGDLLVDFSQNSPVEVPANPVECDWQAPGDDGALTTFGASTNGLGVYTADNFGGALDGALLAASYDGNGYYVTFEDGGATVADKEPQFSAGANLPLDITAQGDSEAYPGTVWVADFGGGDIDVYEPDDFGQSDDGGSSDTCIADDPSNPDYDPDGDADGDGYTNQDENEAGTDPCSSSSTPNDFDDDGVSNLNDPDDDNDGTPDTEDPFAIDPDDGTTTTAPVEYTFNRGEVPGTILDLGFTGLMTNPSDDNTYQDLYDTENVIAGAAAPVLTIENVPPGDAFSDTNDQQYAFQSGVQVNDEPLTVHTTLEAPFSSSPDQIDGFRSQGVYIGNGDQDNYIKLVVTENAETSQTPGLELLKEVDGSTTSTKLDETEVVGSKTVDLYIDIDPSTDTATARYEITGNNIDGTISGEVGTFDIPSNWLDSTDQGMAFGVISTSNGADTFDNPDNSPYTATYTQLEVVPQGQVGNEDPTAEFTTSPSAPTTGEQVTFDASGSSDSDGSIASYSWDFDGDGQEDATGQTATTTFDSAGDKTVELTVTDDAGATATATQTVSVSEPSTTGEVVYAVNAGGEQYTASDGTVYQATSNFAGGTTPFTSGEAGTPSEPEIANTDDDELYWTELYGTDFSWSAPVDNGQYEVTLKFAELYQGVANDGGEGDRIFDVSIEDQEVLNNYDIVAESGGPQTAVDETFTVEVTDGTLNIGFDASESDAVDNAKISAIKVVKTDTGGDNTPPTVDPISDQTVTEGETLDVSVSASDADSGDTPSLSLSQSSPGFASLTDNGDGTGTITLEPTAGAAADSPYTVEVVADDGTDQTTESFQVAVESAGTGTTSAEVTLTPGGGVEASTYGSGSYTVTNTGDTNIQTLRVDLDESVLPDMVFDPFNTAGDDVGKEFTLDGGDVTVENVEYTNFHNGQDNSQGYDSLVVTLSGFEPDETMSFSIDNDPTSISTTNQGSQAAGPVSGLELTGGTIAVGSGSTASVEASIVGDGSAGGAEAVVQPDADESQPTIGVQGITLQSTTLSDRHSAATVTQAGQTVTITGAPANSEVTLQRVETELNLLNVPEPTELEDYEGNKALEVEYITTTTDSNGEATVDVTLTDAGTDSTDGIEESGLNYFTAYVEEQDGDTGPLSNYVVLNLEEDASNAAPTVDAITDKGVTEGESVTVDVPASDENGDDLTYSLSGSGSSFASVADDGTLTIAPGADAVGTYEVTVTASDGSATASESFAVYVDEPDQDGTVVAAVNAGGGAYTADDGTEYAASANSDVFTGGSTYSTSQAIANTEDDTLYQTELYGGSDGGPDAPNVAVPVEDGTYEVTLQFAEIFQGVAGSDSPDSTTPPTDGTNENDRLFTATVEGEEVLTDYDIFSEVGPTTATDKTYTVEVTDGTLNVDFSVTNDNAKISAVKIEQIDTGDDEPALDPIGNFDDAPKDPDGDGLYEDVNGDGSVDVGDAQAIFNNADDPVVENNPGAFDFNGIGGVNVGDAQALFASGVEAGDDDSSDGTEA